MIKQVILLKFVINTLNKFHYFKQIFLLHVRDSQFVFKKTIWKEPHLILHKQVSFKTQHNHLTLVKRLLLEYNK